MTAVSKALGRYITRIEQPVLAKKQAEVRLAPKSDAEQPDPAWDALRNDLAGIRKSSSLLFAGSGAAALILGVVAVVASKDLARYGSFLGEGIGLAGLFRAWRAKLESDLLLALLGATRDPGERRQLVEAFRRPKS